MPTQYCQPRIASPGLTRNPLLNSRGGCYVSPDGGPSMYLSAPARIQASGRSGAAIVQRARLDALRGAPMVGAGLDRVTYARRGFGSLGTTATPTGFFDRLAQDNAGFRTELAEAQRIGGVVAGLVNVVLTLIGIVARDPKLAELLPWIRYMLVPNAARPQTNVSEQTLRDFCTWYRRRDTQDALLAYNLSSILGTLGVNIYCEASNSCPPGMDLAMNIATQLSQRVLSTFEGICSVAPPVADAPPPVPDAPTQFTFNPALFNAGQMFRFAPGTFGPAGDGDGETPPPPPPPQPSFIARNKVPLAVGAGVLVLGLFLL